MEHFSFLDRSISFCFRSLAFFLSWFLYLFYPWAGVLLGRVFRVMRLREKVVRTNFELVYKDETPDLILKRIQGFYRHLGLLSLEILFLFGPMRFFVSRRARVEGGEALLAAQRAKQPIILVSSHIGNWEVMMAYAAVKMGLRFLLVTKRLKPKWLHHAFEKARLSLGIRGTYEPKTMRDVLSELKAGGCVGVVMDQYAGAPVSVRTRVFGVPVGTTTAAAMFARRAGATVFKVGNYRDTNGDFVVTVSPPIPWIAGSSEDALEYEIALNTAHFSKAVEKDILDHSDQWLWSHRRFKGNLAPATDEELDQEWHQKRKRT